MKRTENILPHDRVIINLDQAQFADIILPVKLNETTTVFIGFQVRYLKEGSSETKPSHFVPNALQVLEKMDKFSYVFLSTHLTKTLNNFEDNIQEDTVQEGAIQEETIQEVQEKTIQEETIPKKRRTNQLHALYKYANRVKFAIVDGIVSYWWLELQYKQNPTKRKN